MRSKSGKGQLGAILANAKRGKRPTGGARKPSVIPRSGMKGMSGKMKVPKVK